jgi:stage V sporulation protein G
MKATEVRVNLHEDGALRAYATVTFDNVFAVRNMKIVDTGERIILCMPSRKHEDGTFKDLAHPINAEFRAYLEEVVLGEYRRTVELRKVQ